MKVFRAAVVATIIGALVGLALSSFLTLKLGSEQAMAQEEPKPAPVEEAFAGLKKIRHCIYDNGGGIAIIKTNNFDLDQALSELISRRACWAEMFPNRAASIKATSICHRSHRDGDSNHSTSVDAPYVYLIEYAPQ